MFGFGKSKCEIVAPISPDDCVAKLRQANSEQIPPVGISIIQGNSTIALNLSETRLKIVSQKFSSTPTTVLVARIMPHPQGSLIRGYYRLSTCDRIFAAVSLAFVAIICGGMTAFLSYAAIFDTWPDGGNDRYFYPLIPLGFAIFFLYVINFILRVDPTFIESFLNAAIYPQNIAEQDASGANKQPPSNTAE